MSQSPRRKLKVFQAQFGFYDTMEAAPSQAVALLAWGTHQNLFTSGEARIVIDKAAMAAALKHPGTPLRRAVGSSDEFSLKPTHLPKISEASQNRKTIRRAKPKSSPHPAADHTKLDAAEAALRQVDERQKQEEAEF